MQKYNLFWNYQKKTDFFFHFASRSPQGLYSSGNAARAPAVRANPYSIYSSIEEYINQQVKMGGKSVPSLYQAYTISIPSIW